jgi:ketosteroid isomerase-like protein
MPSHRLSPSHAPGAVLAACGLLASFASAGTRAADAAAPSADGLEALAKDVAARESAFAQTMAERRFDHFADFVAADAVFRGASQPLIGREAVVGKWKAFYDAPRAAFSWSPDRVTVSADGRSALSTGPVRDADGQVVSRFMSIWRLDADGRWRVMVDQGVDLDCAHAATR